VQTRWLQKRPRCSLPTLSVWSHDGPLVGMRRLVAISQTSWDQSHVLSRRQIVLHQAIGRCEWCEWQIWWLWLAHGWEPRRRYGPCEVNNYPLKIWLGILENWPTPMAR
jgi:hypothetical protein